MELFLELAFTISFSLTFSYCFAWFLSIATTDAAEHDFSKKKDSHNEFPEEFEGCSLKTETEIGFGLDDRRPELFAVEVEKTEEKLLDEAREAETQMGLIKEEKGMDEEEEEQHGFSENKTTQFQVESKDYNWEAATGIGFSLHDQSPELYPGEVEETEENSLDEAQEAETQMGLTNEEVGREEKEEKEHDSTGNKAAFVHQRLKLSPGEVEKTEEKPVDEAQEAETEMGLIEEEEGIDEKEEIGIQKSEIDSEDWVGIERSELERLFGAAVAFVDSKKEKTPSFSSDLKLQFFGLYQVAMAGPCLLPQPMALKFAARAKWDAWQQFGNLSSEEAMEHYINLLSTNFPGWMEQNVREPGICNDS